MLNNLGILPSAYHKGHKLKTKTMKRIIVVPETSDYELDVSHEGIVYINAKLGTPHFDKWDARYLAPYWIKEGGANRVYHITDVAQDANGMTTITLGNSFVLDKVWSGMGNARRFEYHPLEAFGFTEIEPGLLKRVHEYADSIANSEPSLPKQVSEYADSIIPDSERVWPQFFLTKVIGSEDLPDLEILTLPSSSLPLAVPNLRELERIILSREVEEFNTIGGSMVDERGADTCRAALQQVILDAAVREELPWNPEKTERYANQVFVSYPIPVMNSPISGLSLSQMVTSAGSGAAFMVAFPHHTLGNITLYFMMIGGTRIVLGAADGISAGLRQGLTQIILRWMGVPKNEANPKKTKSKKS